MFKKKCSVPYATDEDSQWQSECVYGSVGGTVVKKKIKSCCIFPSSTQG